MREDFRALLRDLLVLLGDGIDRGKELQPVLGGFGAHRLARLRNRLARPLLIAQVQQRQIEKPLARIIDDVEVHRLRAERAPDHVGGRKLDRQAKLADVPRSFGPFRRWAGQLSEVALVIETRHRVVGLRLQIDLVNAFLRERLEERERVARQEIMDERRDEHRLARTRQTRHAKADGGRKELCRRILRARPRFGR